MNCNNNNLDCIPEKQLSIKDNIAYYGEVPFTGKASQDCQYISNFRYENVNDARWVKFTYFMPYQNGIKEGTCKAFYENNQVKYETDYKNNNRNGIFIEYYENGNLEQKGEFEDGKQTGIWTSWFENGCQESELIYEKGTQSEGKWWFDDYELKSIFNKQGLSEIEKVRLTHREWYKNGQLHFEKKIRKKDNNTIRKDWHQNGRMERKKITDDEGTGYLLERTFYENDILESEKNYRIGYKKIISMGGGEHLEPFRINHGVHKYWFKNGKLCFKKEFQDGKNHGFFKEWYKNGNLISEVFYANGKRDGVSNGWNSSGILIFNNIYKNGQLWEGNTREKAYIKKVFFRTDGEIYKKITEYRAYNGELLPKSEWPEPKITHSDYSEDSFNDTYYDDQLDLDQQSPEFWDSL